MTSAAGGSGVGDELRAVAMSGAVWAGAAVGQRAHGWIVDHLPGETVRPSLGLAVVAVVGLGLAAWLAPRIGVLIGTLLLFGFATVVGVRAAADYRPLDPGPLDAMAVVRSDPEPIDSGWRATLQLETGERLDAVAFGTAGFVMQQVYVGETVELNGRLRPIGDRPWLQSRHIVGRLTVDGIVRAVEPGPFDRLVNWLRAMIAAGAEGFSADQEALYLGLVVGDDRFQSLAQRSRFRAAGLTHLLAVSGQNVAFALLVVRPLLGRTGFRARLVLTVLVLVVFAAVTRAEPSVLRAASVAAVGAWATATGRVRTGTRALAAGVAAMILIDPFLVDVVGFQLSVAASAGIIVLAPAIARRLPGPRMLAEATAVTVAAQLAVAPLLIRFFGPMPLAALPANLLAGWAAGAVMTAGLTVGPFAGLLARSGLESIAEWIQIPTRAAVDWIDTSAVWSTSVPLPRLGGGGLLLLAAVVVVVGTRGRTGRGAAATLAVGVTVIVSSLAAAMPSTPSIPTRLASGATFLPVPDTDSIADHHSVLIIPAGCSTDLVDELIAHSVGTVDLVISESGDRSAGRLVGAVTEVVDAALVIAPGQHRIVGATRTTEASSVTTAWGVVVIEPDSGGRRLDVELRTPGGP